LLEALGKFKMKINEVTHKQVDEGPIDFAKKVGAGIKGAYQGLKAGGLGNIGAGAKAGYQATGAAQAQTAKVKTVASQALQKWAAYNQNIKMSTGADATPEQAVAWLAQFMGQQPRTPKPAGSNPAQIQQWLQQEIAGYIAQKETPQGTAPQAATQQPAPTPGAPPATPMPAGPAGGGAPPAVNLPDISQLTKEELLQLKQQLQAA
jgi:hypothetical protein